MRHNLVETELGIKKGHHSISLSSIKCSENPSSQITAYLICICNMKIKSIIDRHLHTNIKYII